MPWRQHTRTTPLERAGDPVVPCSCVAPCLATATLFPLLTMHVIAHPIYVNTYVSASETSLLLQQAQFSILLMVGFGGRAIAFPVRFWRDGCMLCDRAGPSFSSKRVQSRPRVSLETSNPGEFAAGCQAGAGRIHAECLCISSHVNSTYSRYPH